MNKKIIYTFLIITSAAVLVAFGLLLGMRMVPVKNNQILQVKNNQSTSTVQGITTSTKKFWIYNAWDAFSFNYPSDFVVQEIVPDQRYKISKVDDLQISNRPSNEKDNNISVQSKFFIDITIQKNSGYLTTQEWTKNQNALGNEFGSSATVTMAGVEGISFEDPGACASPGYTNKTVIFTRNDKVYKITVCDYVLRFVDDQAYGIHVGEAYISAFDQIISSLNFLNSAQTNKFYQDSIYFPPLAKDPNLKNLGYINGVEKKVDGIYIDFIPASYQLCRTGSRMMCAVQQVNKRTFFKFANGAKVYPSNLIHSIGDFKNIAADGSITTEDFLTIFKQNMGDQPFDLMYDTNGNVTAAQEIYMNP